jgi:crotonobetainyl-CoA hydratase
MIGSRQHAEDSRTPTPPDVTPPARELLVRIWDEGAVRVIQLNRPEALNAVNLDMAVRIGDALDAAAADDTVRAVIVTGSGERAFCAGGDLKALARGEDVRHPDHPEWGFAGLTSHEISKPLIAAVNGLAYGGGAELVLACDLVIADRDAVFAFPEAANGLFAGAGGAVRLPRRVPSLIAMELLLTGGTFDAARAADIHFINRMVPKGRSLETALDVASAIAACAPLSVAAHLRMVRSAGRAGLADDWERSQREWERVSASDDWKEGPRAFAEGREPVWTGSTNAREAP